MKKMFFIVATFFLIQSAQAGGFCKQTYFFKDLIEGKCTNVSCLSKRKLNQAKSVAKEKFRKFFIENGFVAKSDMKNIPDENTFCDMITIEGKECAVANVDSLDAVVCKTMIDVMMDQSEYEEDIKEERLFKCQVVD